MKLYWHPFSIVPRRVRIAFREKGVAYEEVEVDLPARAHRRPEFRRLNPFAQVPATASRYAVIEPSKRPGTSIAFLSGSVLIPA